MSDGLSGDREAVVAGWEWLSTLPRAVTAHAGRGPDPLAAMRELLAALGDPHRGLSVVHVAGSKGKGSTALYIEALLAALGHGTFTYTSPHLEQWTERLRLGGREAPPEQALAALAAVREAAAGTGIQPGFFEALTAAGLVLAARERAGWCILECGVGGRADATNVVTPTVAVITGVEREHVERLGSDPEAIAREKAGIIKAGAPVVLAELTPAIDRVFAAAAARTGVRPWRLRRTPVPPAGAPAPCEVAWHYADGRLAAAGPGWAVRAALAAPGQHMAANAALALATVARLGLAAPEALQGAARALADCELPGRMETVSRRPWVVVDGAHTAASAAALATSVRELGAGRVRLLVSISSAKSVGEVLAPLLPLADAVTATRADRDYSLPAADLARRVRAERPDLAVEAIEDPDAAIRSAVAHHPEGTLVLATGSVYLAGRVRAAFVPAP